MNQQVSFLKEKKESIRKATLGAINQAREKKRIAIEDAYRQENETCRAALEAVEELKKKLKNADDGSQKAALRLAIKEANDDIKHTISQAKKEADAIKKTAIIQEKEMVARIREEENQAIASLLDEPYGMQGDTADGLPYDDAFSDIGVHEDNQEWQTGTGYESSKISGFGAGSKADASSFKDDDFLTASDDESDWDKADDQFIEREGTYAGFDEIRKVLEESVKKYEERRARIDFDLPESSGATFNVSLQNGSGERAQKSGLDKPEVTGRIETNLVNAETAEAIISSDQPLATAEEHKEPAIIHEGRIMIVIQGAPPASFMRSFGEKLKQIEDIRILLLGGSSDSGLQVVVLAQKPIPLIEKVVKLAQVEVTSYTTREIYLKYRADLPS